MWTQDYLLPSAASLEENLLSFYPFIDNSMALEYSLDYVTLSKLLTHVHFSVSGVIPHRVRHVSSLNL